MAAVPCVQLRSDRLTFSTDGEFGDDHANVRCALSASSGVLTLSGGLGARVVLRGLASPTSGSAALSAGYSTWKAPVRFITTTVLSVTSPSTGVLQAVANGPLQVDASTAVLGDRILVAGQTGGAEWQNGIYEVTAAGVEGVNPYVLERAADFDDGCHVAGSAVVVLEGTAGNSLYINTNNAEPNWTSDAIAFEQVGAASEGGGGGTIDANSIGLDEMAHSSAGGEVLYYAAADAGNPTADKAPMRLALGTVGYPLVAGTSIPEYAQLTSAGLATGAVTTAKLADGAVTAAKLGDGSVTTDKLQFGAVTSAKLAAGAVTSGNLASGAITADKLAANCVTEAKLANSCVTTLKLADACVTTAKLAQLCVDTAQLANSAVTTAKMQDGCVTTTKIAANAVTGDKLATTVYKSNLVIGTAAGQEYISFAVADEIGFYINGNRRIAVTSAGGVYDGTWSASSDLKWKTVRGPVSADPLTDLDKLDGHVWTWTDTGAFGAGVVAQEFQQVCATAVIHDDARNGLTVNYNAVVAFNLCCNKALKRECARLAAMGAGLRQEAEDARQALAELRQARARTAAQVAALRARVAQLEAALEREIDARTLRELP